MRAHGNGCIWQAWVMATREPEGHRLQETQQAERASVLGLHGKVLVAGGATEVASVRSW